MSCPHGSMSDPKTCSQCLGIVAKRITVHNGEVRINAVPLDVENKPRGRELIKKYNTAAFRTARDSKKQRAAAVHRKQK